MNGAKGDRMQFIIDNDNMQGKCFFYIFSEKQFMGVHKGPTFIWYFKTERFQVVHELKGQLLNTIFRLFLFHFRLQCGRAAINYLKKKKKHFSGYSENSLFQLCLQPPAKALRFLAKTKSNWLFKKKKVWGGVSQEGINTWLTLPSLTREQPSCPL